MAPEPWRSICRSSCFMQLHTPRRLTPITRSQSSRVLSAVGAIDAITPALLNAASSRPNAATVRQNHGRASLGKGSCSGEPHTGGGTRDDGNLAGEVEPIVHCAFLRIT